MIGRLAPGANDVPEMPGFSCSVSVTVAPPWPTSSRCVVTVTATKEPSVAAMLFGSGTRSGFGAAVAASSPGAAGTGVLRAVLGVAGFTTGLGVVTTTSGSMSGAAAGAACAEGAGADCAEGAGVDCAGGAGAACAAGGGWAD
jgi:hypothetical protein